jgi:hypothetical protein
VRVRAAFVVATTAGVLLLPAGCGSGGGGSASEKPRRAGTIAALLARPGEDVALVAGTSDFQPGRVRYSFLVVRDDGRVIERPRARVWLAAGLHARPFAKSTARLEPIGVPGAQTDEHDAKNVYVVTLRVPRPGTYWLATQPVGGRPIQGVANLVVRRRTATLPVGAKAFPSRTPTLASTHGDISQLTTRVPPDRALLRYSVADSLAAHKPFVLVFATPKFCTSRICGPAVDVVNAVRTRFERHGVRFIHVEIYEQNHPPRYNRWTREWGLRTEPWTFLVGADGRIKAKFEGAVSAGELSTAVRRTLLS